MNAKRLMAYGKGDVLVYRSYAAPLSVSPIPESGYTGDEHVIFAWNVKVTVGGDAFLPSFTEGDNSLVVATDSMKNFILRQSAQIRSSSIEGFLHEIARAFLHRYSHMASVELAAERLPFEPVSVPGEQGLEPSGLVFRRSHNDRATASVRAGRDGAGEPVLTSVTSGVSELQLIKVSGSSFAGFIRDEYTTLPEAYDRPLFIYLNINWTYTDQEDALNPSNGRYVAAEQVRDIAGTVFHEIYSPSIQHLLYRIGQRVLERFPQLAQVEFESNNRTWETVVDDIPGEEGKVFTEPRPPYGFQVFTMTRSDLDHGGKNYDARVGSVQG